MFSQFLVFLIAYRLIRKERNLTLIPIAILIAITLAVLIFNIRYIENIIKYGSESIRSLASMEIYALKLPELFLPAGYHKIPGLTAISQKIYYIPSFVKGELWSPYMGLVGILCCALFAVSTYIKFVKKIQVNLSFFWQAAWITAYSTLGGVNLLFGVVGFQMIRATNRYSIWLVAIFLLYALIYVDAKEFTTKNRKKIFIASVAILVAMFIYLDLPYKYTKVGRSEIVEKVISDKALIEEIKSLDMNNLVVYPTQVFPENGPIHKMLDYDFLRIFLNANDVSINYGHIKNSKDVVGINSILFNKNKVDLELADGYQYKGMLINKGGIKKEDEMTDLNLTKYKSKFENKDFILYKFNTYLSKPSNDYRIKYINGWSTPEENWIWSISKKSSVLIYCDDICRNNNKNINFKIWSHLIDRDISISLNNNIIYDKKLNVDKNILTIKSSELNKNINILDFYTPQKPIKAGNGDERRITFAVQYDE